MRLTYGEPSKEQNDRRRRATLVWPERNNLIGQDWMELTKPPPIRVAAGRTFDSETLPNLPTFIALVVHAARIEVFVLDSNVPFVQKAMRTIEHKAIISRFHSL
jgi:hypothetical protein